jgi:hypothetical protein
VSSFIASIFNLFFGTVPGQESNTERRSLAGNSGELIWLDDIFIKGHIISLLQPEFIVDDMPQRSISAKISGLQQKTKSAKG